MRTLTQQEIHTVSGAATTGSASSPVTGSLVFIAAVLYRLVTGKVPSWFQIDY